MNEYPITLTLARPEKFERAQLLLRVLLAIAIGFIGISTGWVMWALYLVLPVIAAIAISSLGAERFEQQTGPGLGRVLEWIIAFYGYMMLVTDRFPTGAPYANLEVAIRPSGRPTVGSALLRLITSLPLIAGLFVLGIVSGFVWIIAAIAILISESYPKSLHSFQRGVLRWLARWLVYHASLAEEYPPMTFDTGRWPEQAPPTSSAESI